MIECLTRWKCKDVKYKPQGAQAKEPPQEWDGAQAGPARGARSPGQELMSPWVCTQGQPWAARRG